MEVGKRLISISLDEELERITNVVASLKELNDNVKSLAFITINDFCKLTGWSKNTVQNLYNSPDFPSCDLGKEKIAEVHAVIDYFKVPRRRR